MRKIICSLMAVAGILAFATVARAECGGMERPLTTAQTDSTTPIIPPVNQESGG
jgi:hypothetical protein